MSERIMKDSGIDWIKEIPQEWSLNKIKNAFFLKDEKAQQDDPVVLSLARSGVKVRDISNNEGQLAESYYNYNPVEPGDLLLNPMDLYSGANCSISKVSGVISPAYFNLKAKKGYNPVFYDYYFKTQYWGMAMFAHGKGVSFDNRWTLGKDALLNYFIPTPSYEEQTKIANFLDNKISQIDNAILKTKESIEEYKKLKQSAITEAVTKGLDPNVEMKDSSIEWIGDIPKHWYITKIKKYVKLQTGSTPSTTNEEWFNGDLLWYTPADFTQNYILEKSGRTLSLKAKEEEVATIIPKESVLIVGIGATAGKIGYTKNECSCNQQITALLSSNELKSKYLMYWMIANTKYLRETALYTTLPILNNDTIGNYLFIVPYDTNEQEQIVDYLDKKCIEFDNLISKKEKIIEELEQYKKSLIYEYVTGKKEVA